MSPHRPEKNDTKRSKLKCLSVMCTCQILVKEHSPPLLACDVSTDVRCCDVTAAKDDSVMLVVVSCVDVVVAICDVVVVVVVVGDGEDDDAVVAAVVISVVGDVFPMVVITALVKSP